MRNTPAPELFVYPDRAELARAAAERWVTLAVEAIQARGRFSVALSGGSTPRDLYAELAAPPFRDRVDWSRVDLFWGDERAVPPDDPQSNFRMVDETLLMHVPVPRENVYRIPSEKLPAAAADAYEQALRDYAGGTTLRFDFVLLGLGANGHTASLFPFTPALKEKERWCVAVWVSELNAYRITLTAPLLNQGRTIAFLVAGSDKAATLREVLRGPYQPDRLPAQLIQPVDGKLLWLVDTTANAELRIGNAE